MIAWVKKNLHYLALFSFSVLLFIINYKPGTWLIGWDNLFPEFDFALNIKRDLFAVWQQYRGLGLVDGMSHASLILHDLERFVLSYFLSPDLIRWVYISGLHLIGGLGMIKLLDTLIPKRKFLSLFGALFFMLNLGTIIQFYLPLE